MNLLPFLRYKLESKLTYDENILKELKNIKTDPLYIQYCNSVLTDPDSDPDHKALCGYIVHKNNHDFMNSTTLTLSHLTKIDNVDSIKTSGLLRSKAYSTHTTKLKSSSHYFNYFCYSPTKLLNSVVFNVRDGVGIFTTKVKLSSCMIDPEISNLTGDFDNLDFTKSNDLDKLIVIIDKDFKDSELTYEGNYISEKGKLIKLD